jgi:hypothetical protein
MSNAVHAALQLQALPHRMLAVGISLNWVVALLGCRLKSYRLISIYAAGLVVQIWLICVHLCVIVESRKQISIAVANMSTFAYTMYVSNEFSQFDVGPGTTCCEHYDIFKQKRSDCRCRRKLTDL